MQRKIKFRAWDKQNKSMEEVELLGDAVLRIKHAEWEDREDFEVMQYVGVRDKNGKEVYEGDILQDDNGKIYQIVWGEQHLLWLAKTNETHCNCYSPRVAEISVIVGNIHENLELLKRR